MTHGAEVIVDQSLSIRVSRDGGALVLGLSGELDLENAATLDDQLARAEDSDAQKIVLDLRGLRFIDSSGLKSILIATRRSREDGNRLGILRGRGEVASLLEVTGIDLAVNLLD